MEEVKFYDIAFNPTFYKSEKELTSVIERSFEKGIIPIFIGTEHKTNETVYKLAYKYQCFAYVGIHPNDISEKMDVNYEISVIKRLLKEDSNSERRIIGIGECGLDSYRSPDNLKKQIETFKTLIQELHVYQLPFFTHLRESEEFNCSDEFIEILKSAKQEYNIKGIVHSVTSSVATLNALTSPDIDFYIGINGISSKETTSIIDSVSIDRILLETDSPFCLIRKSWKGASYLSTPIIKAKNNEPAFIHQICEVISNIKGVDFEVIRQKVVLNTEKLFPRLAQ